ncbi:hypothetical protein LVJ94_02555 [Pendulispora rubella]|uniref:Uncharacterized protein n=1 Tax=Pendulispora rubella TaxID=2741070 RepID=A0ABZ2L5C5_9BACT
MAMAIGACGAVLGDVPEGQLREDAGPLDSGIADAADGAVAAEEICFVPNADILDLAVDATYLYWLRAPPSGGKEFAVESCSKNGGGVQLLFSLQSKPEALALSDKYVFWTINVGGYPFEGTWRVSKQGGEPLPTRPLVGIGGAGPVAIANDNLVTGTHGGVISINSPDTGEVRNAPQGLGNVTSLAASGTTLFYTNETDGKIMKAVIGSQSAAESFEAASAEKPSLLYFDSDTLHWAVTTSNGTTIRSKCNGDDCETRNILVQRGDFQAFAVRNGAMYWTVNEGNTGAVYRCSDMSSCQGQSASLWKGNAQVSRIAVDDSHIYAAARRDTGGCIVKAAR